MKPLIAAAAAVLVAIGQPAPDFSAKNVKGESVSLSDFKGKTIVVKYGGNALAGASEDDALQLFAQDIVLMRQVGMIDFKVMQGELNSVTLLLQGEGEVTRRWTRRDSLVLASHYVRVDKTILRGTLDLLLDVKVGDRVVMYIVIVHDRDRRRSDSSRNQRHGPD